MFTDVYFKSLTYDRKQKIKFQHFKNLVSTSSKNLTMLSRHIVVSETTPPLLCVKKCGIKKISFLNFNLLFYFLLNCICIYFSFRMEVLSKINELVKQWIKAVSTKKVRIAFIFKGFHLNL